MKSSLKNMVFVLLAITLVCSAAVGVAYTVTIDPIARANEAKLIAALGDVLPQFDNNPAEELYESDGLNVYPATMGGEIVGYAIESSEVGFSDQVKLMVGFDDGGKIINVAVLSQSETPGLGANMIKEGNPLTESFKNKQADQINMKVTKDGGDVDALTAATISSRAYTKAVEKAYGVFKQIVNQ